MRVFIAGFLTLLVFAPMYFIVLSFKHRYEGALIVEHWT